LFTETFKTKQLKWEDGQVLEDSETTFKLKQCSGTKFTVTFLQYF